MKWKMAARNKASISHNDAPYPNFKRSAIHDDSVKYTSEPEGVPRVRKRDLIAGVWQETVSRLPNIGGGGAKNTSQHQHETDKPTILKERLRPRSSIQSGERESMQTAGPLALITAAFKKQTPAPTKEKSTQVPKEPGLHRFRPFAQSKIESQPGARQRLGMTPQLPVMPQMSVHELNALLIVPVYKQSSWDIVALMLSYCSTGLEAGIAMVLFLIPSNILRKWWNFFATSWPFAVCQGYWLWIVHLLHTGKRHARTGSVQQTSNILAAGAALAAYNASMQTSYPPRRPSAGKRRSKWRKK